jgi:hypothetical protein
LVEETGVPRENHRQTLSHNVVSSTPRLSGFELTTLVVICTDFIGSYKSNYHTIRTAPIFNNIYFFFKKERKIKVIFFLCRGCDILVLIFLFWIAIKLKILLFFVAFLYTINKNILGLQLSQIGMSTLVDLTMKLKKLTLQGPLYPGNNFFNELTFQQN